MNTDIANTEQAEAWDGETGRHWAAHDAEYARISRRLTARMFDLAAIEAGEAVLDIGCGAGATTYEAARRAAPGRALGLDLSTDMLALARERATDLGLENVGFERADAQVHPLEPGGFDIAISRFGAMFFEDPVAAFANIRSALAPAGRIALMSWAPPDRNEWIREVRATLAGGIELPSPPPGAPGMFGLAQPSRVSAILDEAGYASVEVTELEELCELGPDPDSALAFISGTGFASTILEAHSPEGREERLAELRGLFADRETPDGVLMGATVLLTSARRD